jgi:hypothetical protein
MSAAGEDNFGDNPEFTADFTDDEVEAEVCSSPRVTVEVDLT